MGLLRQEDLRSITPTGGKKALERYGEIRRVVAQIRGASHTDVEQTLKKLGIKDRLQGQ